MAPLETSRQEVLNFIDSVIDEQQDEIIVVITTPPSTSTTTSVSTTPSLISSESKGGVLKICTVCAVLHGYCSKFSPDKKHGSRDKTVINRADCPQDKKHGNRANGSQDKKHSSRAKPCILSTSESKQISEESKKITKPNIHQTRCFIHTNIYLLNLAFLPS